MTAMQSPQPKEREEILYVRNFATEEGQANAAKYPFLAGVSQPNEDIWVEWDNEMRLLWYRTWIESYLKAGGTLSLNKTRNGKPCDNYGRPIWRGIEQYEKGESVFVGNQEYRALLKHWPENKTEPEVGSNWTAYWDEVPPASE